MPQITLSWSGIPAFKSDLLAREVGIAAASRAALVELTAMAENKAKNNFAGSHQRGKPHVGGAQPNIVSGDLRRSIMSDGPTQIGADIIRTKIWPNAIYARSVEMGNAKSNSGAYPYFAPAIKDMRLHANEVLAAAWSRFV